jgi:hypothetical protein
MEDMKRLSQEDHLRLAMNDAVEIKRLLEEGKTGEANEWIRKGKWTVVLNGKVIVKGCVEIRANDGGNYDIFIVGYRVHLPF